MSYTSNLVNINNNLCTGLLLFRKYKNPKILTAQNLLAEYKKTWPPCEQFPLLPNNINPLDLISTLTKRGWNK